MSSDRRPRSTIANADPSPADVEELLRAAQDDLLLKLSVDVHTTTSSSSLDPDLSRRFDVLRSHRAPPPPKREPPSDGPSNLPGGGGGGGGATAASTSAAVEGTRGGRSEGEEDEANKILGDDLAARFAALKGSSSSYLPAGSVARKPERIPKEVDDDGGGEDDDSGESDDGVSKKEVEKLMQWAMDAARLDPDPSNSDDEEGIGKREEKTSDQDDDDEEEDDALTKAQEEKKKKTEKKRQAEGKKPPGRKWFLF